MSPIHASRVAPLSTTPEVLDDVLRGSINPDRIFDFETDLKGIAEAYAAWTRAGSQVARAGRDG